jgi:hypothetical protein
MQLMMSLRREQELSCPRAARRTKGFRPVYSDVAGWNQGGKNPYRPKKDLERAMTDPNDTLDMTSAYF